MLRSRAYLRNILYRFNSSAPKNDHDYDGNIDDVTTGAQKFYKKIDGAVRWSEYVKSREFRKEKREYDAMSYRKMHKDFQYYEASRRMRGFYFEHAASWAIYDYGNPRDVISLQVRNKTEHSTAP